MAKVGDRVYFKASNGVTIFGEIVEVKSGVITKVFVPKVLPGTVPINTGRIIDTTFMILTVATKLVPLLKSLYLALFGDREKRAFRSLRRSQLKRYRKALKEGRVVWAKPDLYETHKNKPVRVSKNGALQFVGIPKSFSTLYDTIVHEHYSSMGFVVRVIGNFVYVVKIG